MPLSADAIDVCNLINLVNEYAACTSFSLGTTIHDYHQSSADSTAVSDATQNESDIKAVLEGLENPRVVQAIARGFANFMSNCNESSVLVFATRRVSVLTLTLFSAMSPPMPIIMPTNNIEAGLARTSTTINALRVGGMYVF